jgi:hypothetical protein
MYQGNGNPMRLLVLAGPDVQSAARWAAVPPEALASIVGDPYTAATEVVRGQWDALLIDPGFLSAGVISLIDGSVRLHGLDVWIFETAANPALFHQALRVGAVPLGKVFKPHLNGEAARLEPQKVDERWENGEPELAQSPPVAMTDEEAIRAALGYDLDGQIAANGANGRKRHNPGIILDTIIESCTDPEQPVLTDAELRALLGEDEH